MIRRSSSIAILACLAGALTLSGCLAEGEADSPGTGGQVTDNTPPTISGQPRGSVKIGEPYSFTPNASDADGDSLTFSIQNKPRWADFNAQTGELSGTPNMGDEGSYGDIRINVSDGHSSASLQQFTVNVNQTSMGAATLSWNPPNENTDGTPLTDLAGYRIYYGVNEGSYPNQLEIDNPGVTTFVVENLTPDTYYFVATAFNSDGIESDFSSVAVKTVN